MSVTIDDLQPKAVEIEIKGVKLTSKPLRLSHVLTLAKLGNIFQNPEEYKRDQIKQAESDIDEVIGELIPDLAGKQLDSNVVLDLIQQLMETVEPDDNQELKEHKVEIDTDPKV